MTVTISNLTVAQSAPAGTIVGVLTARDVGSIIPCNFILSKKAAGYLSISSNNLITVWSGSIAPGYYPVRVRAVGINTRFSGSATFNINVIAAPSLPTPTGITFVTTATSLPDNSPAGTTVATFSVSMSDGSTFAGTLGASPAGTVAISGSTRLLLARALTSADDGSQQWGVSATQNGVTVSSSIAVQVIRLSPPPAPPPPSPPPPAPPPPPPPPPPAPPPPSPPPPAPPPAPPPPAPPPPPPPPPPSSLQYFTVSLTAGAKPDNANNIWYGSRITVGASPVVVTALGRWRASGNTQVHTLKLVDVTTLNVVASVAVPTSGQPAGQFAYANLTSPVTLTAGARYYLLSQEFGGGDTVLLFPSNVVTTTVTTMDGRAFQDSGGNYSYAGDNPNMEYEALDFLYQTGSGMTAVPTSVVFNPSAPVVLDNLASGVGVAAISVTMSNGSQFAGTLSASPTSLVGISGTELVLSRALTSADDGAHACSVIATQNGSSTTGNLTLQVNSSSTAPTSIHGTGFPYWDQTASGMTGATAVNGNGLHVVPVTGTVTLSTLGGWTYGYNGNNTTGVVTAQFMLDGRPISPQLSTVYVPAQTVPSFSYQFDTTTVSDGTHMLQVWYIDHTTDAIYKYKSFGQSVIVHNSGFKLGSQLVPATCNTRVRTTFPASPDFVTYPGTPNLQNPASPWPYTFCPPFSAGGVMNSGAGYFLETINGPTTREYEGDPVWSTLSSTETGGLTTDGGVWIQNLTVETSGSTTSLTGYIPQIATNPSDGGRNANLISGLVAFVEAPDGSSWYGVEVQGRLFRLDHNGAVTTIAGFTKDFSKLAYDNQIGLSEDEYRTRQRLVGNFDAGIDLGTAIDLCFDPRNPNIIYVVKQGDHCICKVDMTGFPGTPAHVSLYAGQFGTPGYQDGAAASALFNNCNSIVMTDGVHGPDPAGVMYVADTFNCVMRKISSPSAGVAGNVSTFIGNQVTAPTQSQVLSKPTLYSPASTVTFANAVMAYPFTIRLNSTGDIILFENMTLHVRRIWLSGANQGHVTHIGYFGAPGQFSPTTGWGWIDVDTKGVFGTVDGIYIAQVLSGDGSAEDYWFLSIDGSASGAVGGGAVFQNTAGSEGYFYHGWAHYPWAIAISKFEGRLLATGVSDRGVRCRKLPRAGDPVCPDPSGFGGGAALNLDTNAYLAGKYIWQTGTVAGRGAHNLQWPNSLGGAISASNPAPFPWDSRPSFISIRGDSGAGFLAVFPGANTFDEMCATYTTDAALGAYIQSGMGGFYPRPELTGNDLRDLIYFIRINTTAGSTNNGGVCVQPGPDDPDTGNYPSIISISATRVNATTITVNWTTSKPTIGFAMAGPKSQRASGVPYTSWSPIENVTVPYSLTWHSATISNCLAGVKQHYSCCAKDMAGNSVYASDQVIPQYISPDGSAIMDGVGTLYSGYGVWTFGPQSSPASSTGHATYYVLLNGIPVANAEAIEVNFGGQVFLREASSDQLWYAWTSYNGLDFLSSPNLTQPSPALPAPPSFDPPYTNSADGTTISGGTGSLTTALGVFTFGSGSGSWPILLNGTLLTLGVPSGSANALAIRVNSNGQLFAQSALNSQWYVYQGYGWSPSANGSAPGPIPIEVACTPNLITSVTSSTPLNAVVATVSVTMSDGSTFAGILSISRSDGGTALSLGLSGSNVVLTGHPTPPSAVIYRVSATQNGVTCSVGLNAMDLVVLS